MKKLHKISVAVMAATTISYAGAAGMSGVLDGMFTNVTAPDVVSSQFRGTISGGGMYVRSPISSIQVMSLDPPRLSMGCGGIDLYLGSFSFITAEKLTQFIRNTAQNAAPLAFKMAIDANFPQLGGILDKFQHMAQMMNDSQRNSCQLAHGIFDGAKDPAGVYGNLTTMVDNGIKMAKGLKDDFTSAFTSNQTDQSHNLLESRRMKEASGKKTLNESGNVTWNALNLRKQSGYTFSITDDPIMAQQLIMSLIGTSVNKEGDGPNDDAVHKPYTWRTRLKDLFRPTIGTDGTREIKIWSCNGDDNDCISPIEGSFATNGIEGFVRKQMYGSETATQPVAGSIIYNLGNCTTGNCGMSASQMKFLNSLGKIPVVGLLLRSQSSPYIISMVAPDLVNQMVIEVSVVYGRMVLDAATSSYSGTAVPKPADFDTSVANMIQDLREVESEAAKNMEKINIASAYIDAARRANGAITRYRPQ